MSSGGMKSPPSPSPAPAAAPAASPSFFGASAAFSFFGSLASSFSPFS